MDTTSFKVEDLTEGDEYEFRVMAYNEVGPSRPSSTAGPIIIQDQSCKRNLIKWAVELQYQSLIFSSVLSPFNSNLSAPYIVT